MHNCSCDGNACVLTARTLRSLQYNACRGYIQYLTFINMHIYIRRVYIHVYIYSYILVNKITIRVSIEESICMLHETNC